VALLDLARQQQPARRARVVAALRREAGADPDVSETPLREALERCGGTAVNASCGATLQRLAPWVGEASRTVRTNRYLRVGLLALLALTAMVLGWIAIRQIQGRLAGLCLLGVALLVAAAGWRVNEVFRQAQARGGARAVDGLVARGRLITGLPDPLRARRLQRLADRLAQQPSVRPDRGKGLREAARACGRRRTACGKVFVALGRIHADNRAVAPATRIRRWIDRWLLWSGIVFLLLVALVTAARGRGTSGAGAPSEQGPDQTGAPREQGPDQTDQGAGSPKA